MDNIKEAFGKVKQDFLSIEEKINILSDSLSKTRKELFEVCDILKEINQKNKELENKNVFYEDQNKILLNFIKEASESINKNTKILFELYSLLKSGSRDSFSCNFSGLNYPAHFLNSSTDPTQNATDPTHFKPLNGQFLNISTGNEGVPTDRQTDRQTDQQTNSFLKNNLSKDFIFQEDSYKSSHNNEEKSINNAIKILDSLDGIKKEIRLKFKRLTDQEITVFSTIYQFEEENILADYRSLSKKLNLTESSIRDYVGRIIKKGIPIEKIKVNNKQIQLSVSNDLKKIVTLNTILQLREL